MIEPAHDQPRRSRHRRSELERLIDQTVLGPTDPELGTCWRFTGTTTPYGRIAKAQDSYTHRLGWNLLRGPIPEGMELQHRCGIYACWNPDHLEPVTHAENVAHRRKSHCKRGHLLSNENVRINPRTGTRSCRACLREDQRRLRATAARTRSSVGKPGRPPGKLRCDVERLLDRTVLEISHPELGACWLFTGPADPYGRIGKGPERYVHRLGWKLLRGPIPGGMELHHRCGVHACTFRACAAQHQRAFRERQASKPDDSG
jgi:HNH endonuclease